MRSTLVSLRRSRLLRCEKGMSTAEYAVGTVAACAFAGLLFKLLTSGPIVELLMNLFKKALSFIF